jgi:hypothetical protein
MAKAHDLNEQADAVRSLLRRQSGQVPSGPRPPAKSENPLVESLRSARLAIEGISRELAELRRRVKELEGEDGPGHPPSGRRGGR